MYRITLTRSASKELHALPKQVIKRISEKLDRLSETPRPSDSKKLKGVMGNLWRIRVGDYRVIYEINDEIKLINITQITHRKDAYK